MRGSRRYLVWWLVVSLLVSGLTGQAVASLAPSAPTLSSVTSLQCPSGTLCVGIGVGGPNLVTSRAPRSGISGWTAETIDRGRLLKLLTCASVHWCLAVDQQDRVLVSTDPVRGAASWRSTPGGAASVLNNVSALSCPTSRLCVGVAGHYVITSVGPDRGGAAWRQALVNPDAPATAIDCPSITRCVAASYDGQVLTSQHPTARAAWTHTRLSGRPRGFQRVSVSCASPARCVVTAGNGDAFSTTNLDAATPTWHPAGLGPSRLGHHVPLWLTVSCTTSDVCAVAANDGSIWASPAPSASTGRHWTRVAVDGPVATMTDRLISIACVRANLCVATDADGHALSANAITQPAAWRRQTIGRPLPANN